MATSVPLHRALAHRALVVHPTAELLFRTVLRLTTGQRRQRLRRRADHQRHRPLAWSAELPEYGVQLVGGLAWVTGGESLHNNYHAHPRAPKFSVRQWEFDPSWVVVRALAAVRMVVIIGAPVSLQAGGPR